MRWEDQQMIKTICTAVLSFLSVTAVWAALEFVYTSTTGGDIVSNLTHPLCLIPCLFSAGIVAGFTCLCAKTKSGQAAQAH